MPRSPLKPRTEPPFRIKDLVELTGISKEAIRFYLAEGLLPPPEKSARNMAWYGKRHVELLQQIKLLQQEHFLSLKAIKIVLSGRGDGEFTEAQLESLQRIRQKMALEKGGTVLAQDPARIADELGLSRDERRELLKLGVAAQGVATVTDVEIAKLWVTIRNSGLELKRGFTPRDIGFVLDAVRLMLDHELEIFQDRLKHLDADQLERVIQQAVPSLSKMFVLMHERAINQFISDYIERNKAAAAPATGKSARKPAVSAKKATKPSSASRKPRSRRG
ncbi:MAG: MerR family transcriptional regulator [Sinimarinibacterium sp.]|jgi:DNA-binding transcriptional MerR regulator